MPSLRRLRSVSLALALMGASAAAWAVPQPPQAPAKPRQAQQPPRAQQHGNRGDQNQQALSDAVRRAERNGQVLSAEQVQYDGRDVNRVKIVDNRGRVRVYWDDPAANPPQDRGQQGKGRQDGKPARDGSRTRDDDDGDPTL